MLDDTNNGLVSADDRARTAACFKHIQVALWCYHERCGCYPPQYLTDDRGQPVHSWRALLLPDLGYEELYRRYRFDEPWNGPHNILLAPEIPKEYRSPFLDFKSTITQYVGIAGKDTPWRGTTPLRTEDLEHTDSNSLIWFVEAANSDIQWMEPRDIPLEQALEGINVREGHGIQSNYAEGLPAQLAPFGIVWVPSGTSTQAFRAMLTIAPTKDDHRNGRPEQAPPSRDNPNP